MYAAQPIAAKAEGAVSYASFSQGHSGGLQYAGAAPIAKVLYIFQIDII